MRKRVKYVLVALCIMMMAVCVLLCFFQWNLESDKHDITVKKCVYQEKNIHINYPQLEGLEEEKQSLVNTLIGEDVVRISSEACEKLSSDICMEMDYQIKYISDKLISIFYTGTYGILAPGEGFSSIAMATTIDMENGEKVELKDIICNMEECSRLLLEDSFESITMWEGMVGTGKISREYQGCENLLLENLQKDTFDICNHYIEWYVEEDKFVFVSLFGGAYEEYAIQMEAVKRIFEEEFLLLLDVAVGHGEEDEIYATYNYEEAYRITDNELLCEYFKEELMDAKRITELLEGRFNAEYFVIDLNEDEYVDYLVRLEGAGYSGSGGDSVYILVGEREGLREVFSGTIRFSSDNVKYGPFVILKEKSKDMHDIVFTAYDKVWRYNDLADGYE